MPKIANKNAREYVQRMEEFEGNHLSAIKRGDRYIVLSYGYYPIYVYTKGQWYKNGNGYSMTTKKQMSQCNPLVDDMKTLNPEQMEKLFRSL